MKAIQARTIDLKKGAEILGVSYATLYGHYRDLYGHLKTNAYPVNRFQKRLVWDDATKKIIQKIYNKDISVKQAADMLG